MRMRKSFAMAIVLLMVLSGVPAGTQPPASLALPPAPDHAGVAAALRGTPDVHRDVDQFDERTRFQGRSNDRTPWSAEDAPWDTLLEQRAEGQPEPATEPSARIGTSQHMSAPEAQPADRSPAQGVVIEGTCPVTTISPVFWDTPPQSGSVIISSSGEEIIEPCPDDEVRVIIQLEDEPVSAYKSRLQAATRRLTSAEREQIRSYAGELQRSHQRLVGEVEAQGIELQVRREYSYIFNGLAASVKMADMERIEALPQVRAVHPDYQVHTLLDDSVPLIGADQVWTMQDPCGQPVTGQGIRVAILDTGIDYTHPDLGGCFGPGCKVADGYDFVNDDADPWDDNGHGTHCAGIVAANGTVKGVAPDSDLYAYKVCNQYGSCWSSDIIAGIERTTDPDGDPATEDAVDIISMSLGSLNSGHPNDAKSLAVDAAVDQGVVVVVAAGNSGPDYQTVKSPGVARKAFTVGATDKSDNIADFSSRGPVLGFYELIKPDIVAPGVSINSTYPGGGYASMSGTSMATPHVAGAAALIKQMHPIWTPEMIKANLMNTASNLGLNVYTQGAGRVQVDDAASVQAVLTPGSVGFGIVDVDQPLWTKTEILRLTNVTTASLSYSLWVSGTLPAGVTTSLEPAGVTLGAGGSVTVTFHITVDNALTPYQDQEPGSYEGQVIAEPAAQGLAGVQATGKPLVVPFAFIKSPRLDMTFDENPWIVLIHDGEEVRAKYYTPGTSLSILLPTGNYDLWVIYIGADPWVIREGVVVSEVTSLSINCSDATHTITLAPRDKDGQAMSARNRRFAQQFEHTPSGISIASYCRHEQHPSLTRHFSDVSADYTWEWRLDAGWRDVYYEFYDQVTGISSNLTYQNTPEELWHIRHQCHTGPAHSQVKLGFYLPYG